jgi:hypothetical protein
LNQRLQNHRLNQLLQNHRLNQLLINLEEKENS